MIKGGKMRANMGKMATEGLLNKGLKSQIQPPTPTPQKMDNHTVDQDDDGREI